MWSVPILDKVTNVDVVLVLQYHVMQNDVEVYTFSYTSLGWTKEKIR
jgi:hypothetical protein